MGILRLLLALSVIVTHATPIFGLSLVPGDVAVQAFFIISGFYMAFILNEKYIGQNDSYTLFMSNRLLRLYPIYWVVLILTVVINFVAYFKFGTDASPKLGLYFSMLANGTLKIQEFFMLVINNLTLLGQDWDLFFAIDPETGNVYFTKSFRNEPAPLTSFMFIPQAWTLGVEISFYLIAPFLARKRKSLIVALIALSLALRLFLYQSGFNQDPWTYRFFPTEMVFFLAGILAYRLFQYLKPKESPLFRLSIPIAVILTLAYAWLPSVAANAIYPVAIFVLIPFLFIANKRNKWDSIIGELSYPIYIVHMLLNVLVSRLDFLIIESQGTTVAIASIAFGLVINEVVTKKLEHFRQARVKQTVSQVLT